MKVVVVVGSYPPDTCGIGDFTSKLAEALRGQGVEVGTVRRKDWSMGVLRNVLAETKDSRLPSVAFPLVGAGIFFFVFFPNKAFLPDWLRAMIGR